MILKVRFWKFWVKPKNQTYPNIVNNLNSLSVSLLLQSWDTFFQDGFMGGVQFQLYNDFINLYEFLVQWFTLFPQFQVRFSIWYFRSFLIFFVCCSKIPFILSVNLTLENSFPGFPRKSTMKTNDDQKDMKTIITALK